PPRPPPRSPPLPYTTLFRSPTSRGDTDPLILREFRPPGEFAVHRTAVGEDAHARGEFPEDAAVVPISDADSHPIQASEHVEFRQDRKSTRLNSSHVSISYAV